MYGTELMSETLIVAPVCTMAPLIGDILLHLLLRSAAEVVRGGNSINGWPSYFPAQGRHGVFVNGAGRWENTLRIIPLS